MFGGVAPFERSTSVWPRLLDPQGVVANLWRLALMQLAGRRAGRFVLTRQKAAGKCGATTYAIIMGQRFRRLRASGSCGRRLALRRARARHHYRTCEQRIGRRRGRTACPAGTASIVISVCVVTSGLWRYWRLGAIQTRLVPLHRGFDWLIFGHFRMGRFSGATSSSMLRATPGWRRIKPARSMVRTI